MGKENWEKAAKNYKALIVAYLKLVLIERARNPTSTETKKSLAWSRRQLGEALYMQAEEILKFSDGLVKTDKSQSATMQKNAVELVKEAAESVRLAAIGYEEIGEGVKSETAVKFIDAYGNSSACWGKCNVLLRILLVRDAKANKGELQSRIASACENRGDAFMKLRQFSDAVESYDNALAAENGASANRGFNNPNHLLHRGLLYMKSGDAYTQLGEIRGSLHLQTYGTDSYHNAATDLSERVNLLITQEAEPETIKKACIETILVCRKLIDSLFKIGTDNLDDKMETNLVYAFKQMNSLHSEANKQYWMSGVPDNDLTRTGEIIAARGRLRTLAEVLGDLAQKHKQNPGKAYKLFEQKLEALDELFKISGKESEKEIMSLIADSLGKLGACLRDNPDTYGPLGKYDQDKPLPRLVYVFDRQGDLLLILKDPVGAAAAFREALAGLEHLNMNLVDGHISSIGIVNANAASIAGKLAETIKDSDPAGASEALREQARFLETVAITQRLASSMLNRV